MESSKEFRYLMFHARSLLEKYGYVELFDKGRVLSYRDRLRFDYRLVCILKKKWYNVLLSSFDNEADFLKKLIDRDELSYIVNNIKDIIKPSLFNEDVMKYLKKNINNIPKDRLKEIEEYIVFCIAGSQSIEKEENFNALKQLLENIVDKEDLTIFDIRRIISGGYSKVYKLGDKIIKIGIDRVCKNIPDNRRLLIPYFKENIGNDFVEITDYVECEENSSFEERYEVYKELREIGIRWLDPSVYNVARLDEKTLKRIKAKREVINNKDIGIMDNKEMNTEELKVGDLIIIDLDHMFWDYELDKIDKVRKELNEDLMTLEALFDLKYRNEKEKQITLKKEM